MVLSIAHSCLVPIPEMKVPVLYVFVDISFDLDHLYESIKLNFSDLKTKFYHKILSTWSSTVQFITIWTKGEAFK